MAVPVEWDWSFVQSAHDVAEAVKGIIHHHSITPAERECLCDDQWQIYAVIPMGRSVMVVPCERHPCGDVSYTERFRGFDAMMSIRDRQALSMSFYHPNRWERR